MPRKYYNAPMRKETEEAPRTEELKHLAQKDLLEIQAILHHKQEHEHRKRLNHGQKAQRTLEIIEMMYRRGNFGPYLRETGKKMRLADSRASFAGYGFMVYLNDTGVVISSDQEYERGEGRPLTQEMLAKRYSENSNDRIVDQMARVTPSHLLQRIKRVLR